MMFENRYISNKQMQREYVEHVICRKLILQGRLLSVLFLILAYYRYASGAGKDAALIFFWGVLMLGVSIVMPIFICRKLEKKSEEACEGAVGTTIVFGDKIKVAKGSQKKTMEYTDVQQIYFLKHIIALSVSKYDGIFLSKEGFAQGDAKTFASWIEEKCKNAKVVERRK